MKYKKTNRQISNNTFLKEMGGKIRAARKAKKMPINILADLSKIDLSNLTFLERGERNCHILSLKSIAEVLDMDVKESLKYLCKAITVCGVPHS